MALAAAVSVALPVEQRRWEDEVVYVVILERFADGDPSNNVMKARFGKERGRYEGGFWGGDLKGARERLKDLDELGVTTVLLYPVMQNDEGPVGKFLPTGYRPKDYEHVDRNFGDLADLRAFVDDAQSRGMRVILDMPITLPGFEHPYLADPSKKGWFGPKTEYGVPRWKVENPEVADYLIGVCKRWKERSGCDGFRLDSAHRQPSAFWKRFVAELKAAPPEKPFLILGELVANPREIGTLVSECGFDGAYDFSAMTVREVFGRGEDVGKLSFIAREAKQFYPAPRALMAQIDNYEKSFASFAADPKGPRTRLALTYLLTVDRVPVLYPGDELGIASAEVGAAFPPDRRSSPFLKHVRSLIALRRREPALRRGTFDEVLARDGVYAFLRTLGDDRLLIVLNGNDRACSFSSPVADRPWASWRLDDLLSGEVAKAEGSTRPIEVEAFGARILRVR